MQSSYTHNGTDNGAVILNNIKIIVFQVDIILFAFFASICDWKAIHFKCTQNQLNHLLKAN